MATRRKIVMSAIWPAAIFFVATSTWLWHGLNLQLDQEIQVTEEMLAGLAELGAQPKYAAEPGTGYNGLRPEPDRLRAQAQMNGLIQRLDDGLGSKPSKKFVLEEFARTLGEFPAIDTED